MKLSREFTILLASVAVLSAYGKMTVCVDVHDVEPTSVSYMTCSKDNPLVRLENGLWETQEPIQGGESYGPIIVRTDTENYTVSAGYDDTSFDQYRYFTIIPRSEETGKPRASYKHEQNAADYICDTSKFPT